MKTEILTKSLRDGSTCVISIVPDPSRLVDDAATTLAWWLEVTIGGVSGRIKARPHDMAPVNGMTHALTLPAEVARALGGRAKVIGLSAVEAAQINAGIATWVQARKAAAAAASEELASSVRAAAPDAETWTISSAHGVPAVGVTYREDDGDRIVTVMATGQTYYREDGRSFGVDGEAGYAYWAEVREATADEAAPLLEQEARRLARGELKDRALEVVASASPLSPELDPPADELLRLPGVNLDQDLTLRLDQGADALWVMSYGYSIWIGARVPLTPARQELFAQLLNEFGPAA